MNAFVRLSKLTMTTVYLFVNFLGRRPAVVHFFLPQAYLIGAPLALLAGVPIRLMSRRSLNLYQNNHPVLRRAERLAHTRMSAIIANSRAVAEELAAEGVSPSRLGTIYNGIDIARFRTLRTKSELRRTLDVPEDAVVFTIVANLIPYKGHVDLLDAFGAASRQIKPTWLLLIVGRDDGIGRELIRRAEELGIASRVRFLGPRNDIPDILNASDVGVSSSHEEGFSNAVLEAMACGLATIVTRVGGNPEAVIDGETGLVVPPRDPDSLAAAIVRLAGDATLRGRCGCAGRARVLTDFTIESCVDKYERVYHALLDGRELGDISKVGPSNGGLSMQSLQKSDSASR
jgi:glycosyltransferase involved in cell wall biosynthesis